MTKQLILASSSPRRQELLQQVHIPFSLRKQNFDESLITETDPRKKVEQLAWNKGKDVPIEDGEVILSSDTVVSYQGQIFEKPNSEEEARAMMEAMSGDVHEVMTGVYIRSKEKAVLFTETTEVEFWDINEEDLGWYVKTQDPYDKAGAYGIQSLGAMFVKRINGDYYTVMGLPISRVVQELKEFSISPVPTK
ncbi:Maf family protein [Salimicrobium halophilum]|uniref:dTTP/UTP pyrophosphatase n=1 Tax=Salimicrobium halophilum TaxID=86666 RepID=A0A1G8R829_9BACI|nr:Maf family protein [Salimicrobium halophilum]SDJ13098.1 septum formation protein [Salimicrobium halophilum]